MSLVYKGLSTCDGSLRNIMYDYTGAVLDWWCCSSSQWTGIILCLGGANERLRYIKTWTPVVRVHVGSGPWRTATKQYTKQNWNFDVKDFVNLLHDLWLHVNYLLLHAGCEPGVLLHFLLVCFCRLGTASKGIYWLLAEGRLTLVTGLILCQHIL